MKEIDEILTSINDYGRVMDFPARARVTIKLSKAIQSQILKERKQAKIEVLEEVKKDYLYPETNSFINILDQKITELKGE